MTVVAADWATIPPGTTRLTPRSTSSGSRPATSTFPPATLGMWQGALRHPDDPSRAAAAEAIDARQPLTVEVLYTDLIGAQRTISRIGLIPTNDVWLASLNRHWYLDWDGPRPDTLSMAAAEVVLRDHDAAQQRRAAREPRTIQPGQ
jgi:hypothetical protein